MSKKKRILLAVMALTFLLSCKKDHTEPQVNPQSENYLTFGHFYGMCIGEECVEIFQLDSERLWEDQEDTYPSSETSIVGDYIQLSNDKFLMCDELIDQFPMELLAVSSGRVGTPDIADGGGVYLEYNFASNHGFWLIDNTSSNIPTYLQSYVDLVHEIIALINQ